MTALQEVQLNLLKEFLSACEKLGLEYFLVCGSAMGAAKFQGFIPWDDDLDVGLPRKDYEVFVQKAQALLPEHVFVQNHRTDPEFPFLYSKLRDSRTTYIEESRKYHNMNHGVYIDVFPIDGHPKAPEEVRRFKREKAFYELRWKTALHYTGWKRPVAAVRNQLVYAACAILGLSRKPADALAEYSRFLAGYELEDSLLWCNYGNKQKELEYAPREQYGQGTMLQFEGLTVRVPEQYDAYLTQKYGAWREDIPQERKKGTHPYLVCDLDRPYTDYAHLIGK